MTLDYEPKRPDAERARRRGWRFLVSGLAAPIIAWLSAVAINSLAAAFDTSGGTPNFAAACGGLLLILASLLYALGAILYGISLLLSVRK